MATAANILIPGEELYDIFNDSDDEGEFLGFQEDELPNYSDDESDLSESSDEEDATSRPLWDDDEDAVAQLSALPVFSGAPGFKKNLPENPKPLDYFNLYFTDDIIQHIVVETNRYAEQIIAATGNLSPSSRLWKPTNPDELKVFIALILAMGVMKKSDLQDYWSNDEVLNTPFFKLLMPRDRFLAILSFSELHNLIANFVKIIKITSLSCFAQKLNF